MKKTLLSCLAFLAIGGLNTGLAQVSVLGNAGSSGDYVGWDNTNNFALKIKHEGGQPIGFYIGTTAQKMTLWSNGRLAIGHNFSSPAALLHLDGAMGTNDIGEVFLTNGPSTTTNAWRMYTGTGGGTEKFRLFVPADSTNVLFSTGTTSGKMLFQTSGVTRLFINRASSSSACGVSNVGFIGTGGIVTPAAPLHIQGSTSAITHPDTPTPTEDWNRGAMISGGSLYFTRSDYSTTDTAFLMAYPYPNASGNFFGASASSINASATLDTAYMISCQDNIGTNPLNTIQFFKNALITQVDPSSQTLNSGNERRLGVNTINPQNVVHINTYASSSAGVSGIRLEDLTSSATPTSNPGSGVLSVDSDGDVIYVTDNGGLSGAENGLSINSSKVVLGQDVGQTPDLAELTSDREIPMKGYQLNLDTGYVNVNSLATETEVAGLSVRPTNSATPAHPITTTTANRALNVINTNNSSPIGVDVYTEGETSTIGINSIAEVATAGSVQAVVGSASSEVTNGTCVGVDGIALGNGTERNAGSVVAGLRGHAYDGYGSTYGVLAEAEGESATSYGVYGRATGSSNTVYGVYGISSGGTLNIGVYGQADISGSNRAGYFTGDLNYTGTLYNISDKKFKQNITKEEGALNLLKQLNPVTYDLKTKEFSQIHMSGEKQHGFIAQELESILPELVQETRHPETRDAKGNLISEAVDYKSVNYTGLISINTQAINELNAKVEEKDAIIKEQEKKIEDMNARLSQLENCLSALLPALCQMNQSAIEQNTPESQQTLRAQLQTILSDRNAVVLTQNVPNPFAETTTIEYNIPATVAQAQIHFYDAQGKLIQSVDITTRGNGELKVFANDLSKGTYTYNLVADGKIVASKKMMKL